MIAQFIDDFANGRSPRVFSDGSQTRDFMHVDDIVRGLIRAGEKELNGVYNLGTGEAYSFTTVVDQINEEFDTDIQLGYVKNLIPEEGYVNDTWVDVTKIHEALTGSWK